LNVLTVGVDIAKAGFTVLSLMLLAWPLLLDFDDKPSMQLGELAKALDLRNLLWIRCKDYIEDKIQLTRVPYANSSSPPATPGSETLGGSWIR